MGNKLCCDEGKETINLSYQQDKLSPTIDENNTVYTNDNKKNNIEKKNDESLDNNLENNKSNENFFDEIQNLKSSIFDNENDDNSNNEDNEYYNDNDNKNNHHQQTNGKKKNNLDINKSANNSDKNILRNKKSKKKKKNEHENYTENKKIINNNSSNKNTPPFILNNFHHDKENEYYLINTSHYIGLKNSNSNLVFLKNNKDTMRNKLELTPIIKKKNKNIENNIIRNNYSISQKSTINNPNIVVTTRSHNIPFGEKFSDKNNSNSSNNRIRSKIITDYVNKSKIMEKLHNNNKRIIEIYINNQLKKIIKFLKNNKRKTKYNSNNEKIRLQKYNNFEEGFNDISFEILNSGTCQTILNKEKNFCIKYFDNGSIYIGEIENNKCNGHGKFMNSKGDITMSFFMNNYLQEYGIIEIRRNNSIFEGEFEKNKFNGYGIELFEDGSTFYGQYENNKKSGIGTYDWRDGSQYQGEWKNGLPNGLGIFSDNKNRLYEGEWKYGKMNGIGLYKWDDGRKYIGLFNEDKREGFGIFFWPKPLKVYLGFWVNGFQDGIGKIYTSFKERYYLWQEGKIIKKLSETKILNLQLEEYNKLIKKYYYFFRMSLDDLLTIILDL